MKVHDPDSFELQQALRMFRCGELPLTEICSSLGIRPGPVYDAYVSQLKQDRAIPAENAVKENVEEHVGYDRVYNDLPLIVRAMSEAGYEWYLYELADYEPLPDTEWVIFFLPDLGLVKLYTSLFYDLGCYVEIVHAKRSDRARAEALASTIAKRLNSFYRGKMKEQSLSHG